MIYIQHIGRTDRHHCLKSGNIPKSCEWPDSPQRCDRLMIIQNSKKEDILGEGSMPCLPEPQPMTCGGPEALTSTTISKKCGGKTSSGHKHHILETNLELPYQYHDDQHSTHWIQTNGMMINIQHTGCKPMARRLAFNTLDTNQWHDD